MARGSTGTRALRERHGGDVAFGYHGSARASLVASALACAGLIGGVAMLALSLV
ncbi:MAG: hypothetical protein ACFE0R_06725 [Salinarimonas sp.]